jgi:hypothetical protein
MRTLPETTPVCKARHAQYKGLSGLALRDPNNRVWFVTPASEWVELYNADAAHLVLLGDCALANLAEVLDQLRGGYAAIACSRAN